MIQHSHMRKDLKISTYLKLYPYRCRIAPMLEKRLFQESLSLTDLTKPADGPLSKKKNVYRLTRNLIQPSTTIKLMTFQ